MKAQRIRVTGIVQGVGFRPTVWRLARDCGLVGKVWNDAKGVLIEVWGQTAQLAAFGKRLQAEPPPLAQIEAVCYQSFVDDVPVPDNFQIIGSQDGPTQTGVAADTATCPQCLAEVMDPGDRRYRYPFANCTHCGPRLSIIRAIPYDRARTCMAIFPLCARCQSEFDDPAERRFHAQPNACADCGPKVWLEDKAGKVVPIKPDCDSIAQTAKLLQDGWIVAIKGIGGIHLACDAGNEHAVSRLRRRKQRYGKAFALMATDSTMVARYTVLDDAGIRLLEQRAAPIVVLQEAGAKLAASINPGQHSLGFMLPYTPLHSLLMQTMPRPIVLTSGNRSQEPQVISNQEARRRLAAISDYFLLHDRCIVNRLDDSVQQLAAGAPRMLRRARGFAPQPLALPKGLTAADAVLAMGGELKSTFCLLQAGNAIVSQHLGDLEDAVTFKEYQHSLQRYRQLFAFSPGLIAIDRHPDYLSAKLGHRLAAELAVPILEVQHHHAHIASCMAEHGLPLVGSRVLGVALDGLGYGDQQTLWGGEFLLADYVSFERLAHFQAVAMLGGSKAIQEPWRNTLAHFFAVLDWDVLLADHSRLSIVQFLESKPRKILQTMAEKGLNSPLASSAGRLFDAAAAAIGICRDSVQYEGQAAMEIEVLAQPCFVAQSNQAYPFEIAETTLSWAPMWLALLQDLEDRIAPGVIAARFHHCVSNAVVAMASRLCDQQQLQTVVLSGGVFQNSLLLQKTSQLLGDRGLEVLAPRQLPMNDGALSLGQAVIAAANKLC